MKESMDGLISEQDIDHMMTNRRSNKFLNESPNKNMGSQGDLKSDDSEIPNQYDNQTTQNLCDLMNQANTSGRIFIPIRRVKEDESEYGK